MALVVYAFYVCLTYFNFFLERLDFQVNQENIHPNLTMEKFVLALKDNIFGLQLYIFEGILKTRS